MKKLLALLLVLVMGCSLMTACGSSNETKQAEAEKTGETAAPAAEKETEAAAEETQAVEEPEKTAEPTLNRADEATWDTSVDIVAIIPRYGVYSEGGIISSYKTEYRQAVCQCLTADGSTEWLYIEIDDYKLFFDEDASLSFDQFLAFSMVAFPEPVRIDGAVTDADSLVSGLSDSIGTHTVIFFGNATVQSGAKIPETAYTADTGVLTCVYSEIVSIVPAYTLSNGTSSMNTHVVCQAKDANGDEIWVAMSIADYKAYIDETASLEFSGLTSFSEMTFETPLVVHGISVEAETVASGLAAAIGCDTVINFSWVS